MPPLNKMVVLVGLMGSGKSRVGAELAKLLDVPFLDSDREIEKAAGMPVQDIFSRFGEQGFRDGERKVIARLLKSPAGILATGGGAFMQDDVRAMIKASGISVWLKADLETLIDRTARTEHRPLLQGGDRAEKLKSLMDERYDIYAEADITVPTDGQSPQVTAVEIREALERFYDRRKSTADGR